MPGNSIRRTVPRPLYAARLTLKTSSTRKKDRLRVGICGGTFDPVHHGHLILAQDALDQLGLDLVLFVPCARSPHKLRRESLAPKHRLAMLRVALKGRPQFGISSCEIERGGVSYAINTLEMLQPRLRRARFFWLIGDDQLPKLHTWERLAELRRKATFVCAARGEKVARKQAGVVHLRNARRIDISSSEIRDRLQSGKPINHLVPQAVADYITRFRLYRR
jgi:nicotinate-nucleotide adenylyltransferase